MGFGNKVLANLGTKAGALLVGTIFAIAGWLVTHIVENVISVPTVEYDIDLSNTDSGRFAVTIRNLSQDHKFSQLKFMLRLPLDGPGKFKKGAVEPIPPAYTGRQPTNQQNFDISYPPIGMHPGTSVRLTASYTGKIIPTFYIVPSGEGVRLIAKGFSTWVIRNEVELLFVFLGVWALRCFLHSAR